MVWRSSRDSCWTRLRAPVRASSYSSRRHFRSPAVPAARSPPSPCCSNMNIRQLETFYWIARLGTFSAAADRLATSQANVSARIRELENELDVFLFDRIGRQVQL